MRKQKSLGTISLRLCPLILFCLALPLDAQLWSGIIQSPRAIDWTTAGSPAVASSASWTQCGSTVAAGASAATINAALAACTAGHYVQLAAGTYNLTASITFGQKSNIKLVGMGADQTFLVFGSS